MKSIIQRVMAHFELVDRPPVLIDIGASGDMPAQWESLAPHSICVAFDADTRDFAVTESESKGWKRRYSMNRLVAARASDEVDFFLTRSPYCSSSLRPDNDALAPWAFRRLFDVEKTVRLPAVELKDALSKIGIDHVDWYKTDSQGTDLRIFDSLPNHMVRRVIAADFEPGIIDAYVGEDKLYAVLAYMEKLPFWVSDMTLHGSQRIDEEDLASLSYMQKRRISVFLRTAPGWCEIAYLNDFSDEEMGCREHLLGWIFSSIKGEHGFALHLAKSGAAKFRLDLFEELQNLSRRSISTGYLGRVVSSAKAFARSVVGRA